MQTRSQRHRGNHREVASRQRGSETKRTSLLFLSPTHRWVPFRAVQLTKMPRPGTAPVGMLTPASAQPPVDRMLPVPLMRMLLATITKQDWPLLDLLTAPLNVTLE